MLFNTESENMAKKEVKTDLWVASQLIENKIKFDAQGSNVKEIDSGGCGQKVGHL